MPFLTSVGSAILFGFGLSSTNVAGGGAPQTYSYFYNPGDSLWSNASSWYTTSTHDTVGSFPVGSDNAVLLSDSELILDGRVELPSHTYFNWVNESSAYWAPPLSIASTGFNLTLTSHDFYDLPGAVPTWTTGTNYNEGSVVVYEGLFYYAHRYASNVPLYNGIPDSYYWGAIGDQPFLPDAVNVDLGEGTITFQGVNNGNPI